MREREKKLAAQQARDRRWGTDDRRQQVVGGSASAIPPVPPPAPPPVPPPPHLLPSMQRAATQPSEVKRSPIVVLPRILPGRTNVPVQHQGVGGLEEMRDEEGSADQELGDEPAEHEDVVHSTEQLQQSSTPQHRSRLSMLHTATQKQGLMEQRRAEEMEAEAAKLEKRAAELRRLAKEAAERGRRLLEKSREQEILAGARFDQVNDEERVAHTLLENGKREASEAVDQRAGLLSPEELDEGEATSREGGLDVRLQVDDVRRMLSTHEEEGYEEDGARAIPEQQLLERGGALKLLMSMDAEDDSAC